MRNNNIVWYLSSVLGLDLLPFMYGGMVSYKLKENPIDDVIEISLY